MKSDMASRDVKLTNANGSAAGRTGGHGGPCSDEAHGCHDTARCILCEIVNR